MSKTAIKRLREYREKHFKNDYELADLLDMTRAHFSQVLNGRRSPGLDTAVKIEDVTGIPARSWSDTRQSKTKSARKHGANFVQVA